MSRMGSFPYLAAIHVYPLKSTRAVDLAESRVEPWGLAGDRRWLLVDDAGRFISQRDEPALARVIVQYAEDPGPSPSPAVRTCLVPTDLIAVSADDPPPLIVPAPSEAGGA